MIPTFLITRFGPTAAKAIVYGGIALMLTIAIGLFIWHERSIGAAGVIAKDQAATIQVQDQNAKAQDNAAAARVDATKREAQQQQELDNAIDNSQSPDDRRRARGCVVLKQQGVDTSRLP